MMEGTADIAENILGIPVRTGFPMEVGGLKETITNPVYSTGVGLVEYGARNGNGKYKPVLANDSNMFNSVFESMKNWFREFF